MKRAIIVGCEGQDGQLLSDLLSKKGYTIIGLDRNVIRCPKGMRFKSVDIIKSKEVSCIVKSFKPNEIYHLAAFHHSSEDEPIDDVELFRQSYKVNVSSLVNFLDAIRKLSPKTRLFYASSSHIFGETSGGFQDENTPINPGCIYGITKAAGLFTCRLYRNKYSIFVSTGILYNHESSLREDRFVSKKIIKGALNIKNGKQAHLVLGDLHAEIDVGYAPDYVKAMRKILSLKKGDDFIVASGKKHSILDFVKVVFEHLGLDWKQHVREDRKIITRKNVGCIGDPGKLKSAASWKPSVDFRGMIRALLTEEGVSL